MEKLQCLFIFKFMFIRLCELVTKRKIKESSIYKLNILSIKSMESKWVGILFLNCSTYLEESDISDELEIIANLSIRTVLILFYYFPSEFCLFLIFNSLRFFLLRKDNLSFPLSLFKFLILLSQKNMIHSFITLMFLLLSSQSNSLAISAFTQKHFTTHFIYIYFK